jgi:ribosomal protein S18 acetylase RimI-like enzyme
MASQAICAKRELRLAGLREFRARDLEPLLAEQIAEWRRKLDWDYSRSAEVVRSLADSGALGGAVLVGDGEVVGLGYCGVSGGKAQIWDVYVREAWRGGDAGSELFRALIDMLADTRAVRRIECQFMLGEAGPSDVRDMRAFERILMRRDAMGLPECKESSRARFRLEPWNDRHQDAAATVLSAAHAGHIDAEVSEQYATFAAAKRFVSELICFPGSGAFCPEASLIAFDRATGEPAGLALTNFVAGGVGHIGELSVTPGAQGHGLGHELLRQSIVALAAQNAKRVSLTVTACNDAAIRLYSRFGFRKMRRFFAHVGAYVQDPVLH